jgi:hypothetical protein
MRFIGLVYFHESTPNKSLMNVKKLFNIFSRIRGDIRARSSTFRGLSELSELSVDYTAERHAFLGYNSRKV